MLRVKLLKTTQKLALIVLTCLMGLGPVSAQTELKTVAGDYEGTLGSRPLHFRLHVRLSSPTILTGTLDIVDEGAFGIPCTKVVLLGTQLSFQLPAVDDSYKGEISKDGNIISGRLIQSGAQPLELVA